LGEETLTVAIYTRPVVTSESGKTYNKYTRIKEGRGMRTGNIEGPFFFHPTVNGVQKWVKLTATTFEDAKAEAAKSAGALDAQRDGLTVKEAEDLNAGRVTLRNAVDHFLQEKIDSGCTPNTLKGYTQKLEEFLKLLPAGVLFVDQIVETKTEKGIPKRTSSALKYYMRKLQEDGASARTVFNKMEVVFFMLKEAGIPQPSKLVVVPDYEDEEAVPYTREDLKKLFDAMDEDETFLFTFFLDSACRKGEIAHATWKDIYDGKYHVRAKTYRDSNDKEKKFTVKTHEDRRVPLTRDLQAMIEKRRKKATSPWLFPNENGNPDNDNGFIRTLKRIAKKAGLICGQCRSEITKSDRYGKNKRVETVWCADDCQVCEQHYLHRLRKTCATHWHNTGVPVRTIQHWLGHKSLETTMIYLGIQDTEALQEQVNTPKY
jgi:integrase